ncbi:hypothetical protein SteCoe_3784 [Stentor coeruleus]|uniref:Myb-like DNA-binding domain containing protein n=1 Tax=Stentor coeruleus TaxID=5963 RepID=A0A1R2CWE5_9CILI|nr:hypothetical protein SteCoe_3784 [Stentor coeruleus]
MDSKDLFLSSLREHIDKPFHIEGDIWLVPCTAKNTENSFKPLLRPLETMIYSNEYTKKKLWNPTEDETLLKCVLTKGTKAWGRIAQIINSLIHNGMQIRQGRQCRERWFNHVDPSLNKGLWTIEEDEFLMKMHDELGNRWSEIAKYFTGRNENSVKNRLKSLKKQKKLSLNRNQANLDDISSFNSIVSSSISDLLNKDNKTETSNCIPTNSIQKPFEKRKITVKIPKVDISKQEENIDISPSSFFLAIQ